jgi:hypothetical protein
MILFWNISIRPKSSSKSGRTVRKDYKALISFSSLPHF